jgi:dihydroxyacid dehydratase/phosphogluconate dehydratase
LSEIFSVTQRLNVLTVSDLPHFAERGGMIGLVRQQDRIRFEVNRTAAEKANLVLSSELLKLATKVIEKPLAENR